MPRSNHARAILILLALLLPSLAWIGLDKSVWPWDMAWYGQNTVELFYVAIHSPRAWPHVMISTLGRQPPAIAWIGQAFVPIGGLIGSIDMGLLLSILLIEAVVLYLIYRIVWELSGGRVSSALTALIVGAAAPLSVALGHFYLVEMSQAAAVAWFVLIVVRAQSWPRLLIVGQLALATAFAMLTKVTSPVFCILPGLVATYYVIRRGPAPLIGNRVKIALTFACAIALNAMTIAWYAENLRFVVRHARLSSSGAVAELYGGRLAFFASLGEWLAAVQANLLSPLSVVVGAIVLLIAMGITIAKRHENQEARFGWMAVLAALQMALVLVVFSLSSNRDSRYLLPAITYVALIVSWAVWRVGQRAVTLIVMAAFLLQWAQSHALVLGLIAPFPDTPIWLSTYHGDPAELRTAHAIVARTCDARMPRPGRNVLAVQLRVLNPPGLDYLSAKTFLPARVVPCKYDAVAYYDTDVEQVWQRVLVPPPAHYIAIDPKAMPMPTAAVDKAVNQMDEPILHRIEASGEFRRESDLTEDRSIWIYKHVGLVATGRALSDQGQQARAIEVLRAAAAAEPANVEAWANLAFACERAGDLAGAVAAGERARQLDPRHPYAVPGLARVLRQQGQQAFAARDETRGCERLRRARDLQPADRDILADLSRHACASAR